jgi:SnoaL-like domain
MGAPAERARAAFARRAWREAYGEFTGAGQLSDAEDLEQLAFAAYLIGAEDWVQRAADACRARQEGGEQGRAARCAFWAGFGLMNEGKLALGSGWLARAHELAAGAGDRCPELGLLLIPQAIACCDDDPSQALQLFTEAASVGRAHSDNDLLAIARMGQGQAWLAAGTVREALAALDEAMLIVTSEPVSPLVEGIVYCGVIDACQRALELWRAAEWARDRRRAWALSMGHPLLMDGSAESAVRSFLAAWSNPEADRLASFLAEDAVWVDGPNGVHSGSRAIVDELVRQLTIPNDSWIEIDTLLAADGTVMVEWHGGLTIGGAKALSAGCH